MSQILLVRHGQASWGSADYDVLSGLGGRQAVETGRALAARGASPDIVVHGALERQRETARLLVEGAGWETAPEEDAGWDEMDHHDVLGRHPSAFTGDAPSADAYEAWFEAAFDRWLGGDHDHEYDEPFPLFSDRVLEALDRLTGRAARGGTVVVVTSGGPIARVASTLLDGGAALHQRLAPVMLNASVSKVVTGRRGATLVSFNDHSHLEAEPGLLTYR